MTHPLRGTCNDESCPKYGYCHCGCKKKTWLATQNRTGKTTRYGEWTKGQPVMWLNGHHGHAGCYKRTGVDAAKVKPLVQWLRQRYSRRQIRDLFGIATGTTDALLYTDKRVVSPRVARKIVDAVMEHKRDRGADPFSFWEVEPRPAYPEERRHDDGDAERRRQQRTRENELRRKGAPEKPKCQGGCGQTIARNAMDQEMCMRCRNASMAYRCTTCDKGYDSDHGLYLHSLQKHGDRTQGRHSWRKVTA